jgi:uncharacterized protein YbbC (DUF1343 family)
MQVFIFMIKLVTITFLTFFLIITTNCQQSQTLKKVKFGDEVFTEKHLGMVKGKQVGMVTNQTGVLSSGVSIIDTLVNLGINVTVIFGLEHGFRSNKAAGESIESYVDEKTGIPVYSLYGKVKKPSKTMLRNVDIILFDVQDIGARFYTYISTLFYVLQSAAENGISVIVLDRPNPIGGNYVDGPVLDMDFKSFIGIAQIPVVHGLTLGEIANLFVGENYISTKVKPYLKVIECESWQRNYYWNDFRIDWIPTSPNIPEFETALVYPGSCFLEGTNVSEGRGTNSPFLIIGAPFIDSEKLTNELKLKKIKGANFSPVSFVPVDIPGKSTNTKYKGIKCKGIKIKITDENKFKSVEFGIYLLSSIIKLYPESFKFNANYFDLLAGSDKLRNELFNYTEPEVIINSWNNDLNKFQQIRKKYLLY